MSDRGSTTGSMSSYASGSSSVADTDARALNELSQDRDDDELASELPDQGASVESAVFASVYTLSKNRTGTDPRWTIGRMALEALQMFIVIFNPMLAWNINTDLWVWKAVSWTIIRNVVAPMGYHSYITVLYLIAITAIVVILLTVYASVVLKEDENPNNAWLRRFVWVLQFVSVFIFTIFWPSIMDYLAFMCNCHWEAFSQPGGARHIAFPEQNCFAMPHLAHMAFSVVALVSIALATLCMSFSDCDLNPLTRNHLASPVAIASLRIMALKMGLVLVASILSALGGKAQALLLLLIIVGSLYFILTLTPFYHTLVNYLWAGIWVGLLFTVVMLLGIEYTINGQYVEQLDFRTNMTWGVLYGIFPAMLLGAFISYCYVRYRSRPVAKFIEAAAQAESNLVLKDVYHFKDVFEAEFLLRVMRKWDEDGVPDSTAVALGAFMIKCAMARLPNSPTILCLFSNFILETRKDSQAARTQLQLAIKNGPSLAERYLIYVSQRVAKRLKSDTDGLDLIGYVEFQRAYRACVRAHQLALQAQRQFWQSMMRSNVSFKELQDCFEYMDKTERKAEVIYKRVMERYPSNGKLLKIYGRFREHVCNDPWGASKLYGEATKQGTVDSLLSLAAASAEGDINVKLTSVLGSVDEKNDGLIIINNAGIIMMVNAALSRMFGYEKGELEGKNVSTLMPQPYSARHNGYLQRYASTGQAKSIGNLRQLVALHKDRSVFPIGLLVLKLSGIGADNIFMGVIRDTTSEDISVVKVWTTPAGIVLCADEHFRDWFGIPSRMVVGRSVGSLTTDPEGFNMFLTSCAEMSPEQLAANPPRTRAKLLHKYLAPVDAEVTLEAGGSDGQRIYMLELKCIADTLAVMATDTKGRIQFATSQMAEMLGYSVKTMTTGMNINSLLPPPYAQLHSSFMKDLSQQPPPNSCRAGSVVQLMHANGSKLAVTLQISQHDDGEHTQHVIKVMSASSTQLLDSQRVELQLNHKGTVLSVNENASKAVFGFAPKDLVGRPLGCFVNLFSLWKHKFGEDESLLVLLGMRAEQNLDVIYRAGVHNPYSATEMANGNQYTGASEVAKSTLLGALASRHKEQPAIINLKMSAVAQDAILALNAHSSTVDPEVTPVLTLTLFRAEGLTSVVEVDSRLNIVRAEPTLGLIFGVPHATLLRKKFTTLVNLPPNTVADDLLSSSGKKSQLKQGAAWRIGPVKQLEARHLDEGLLKMSMQAVTKDGKTTSRLLILLKVLNSSTGSLGPLLALKAATSAAGAGSVGNTRLLGGERQDVESDEDEPAAVDKRADSPELHDRLDSRLRVQQWVSNDGDRGDAPGSDDDMPGSGRHGKRGSGRYDKAHARYSGSEADGGGAPDAAVVVSTRARGQQKGMGKDNYSDHHDDDAGSEHAGSDIAGSVASGSHTGGGSEAMDAASVASDVDDELVVDWRRAKRLRKLNHMMTSSGAQAATARFQKHTYVIFFILMAAHIICCALMLTQIDGRYQTVREVGDMTEAVDRSQMIATLSNMIQKCADPSKADMPVCHQDMLKSYITKMQENYDILKYNHQHLYLGYGELRQFPEPRLMRYWTSTELPESLWYANKGDELNVIEDSNSTLWNMGNKYLRSCQDVIFNADTLKHKLAQTRYWNYIYFNGPESIFHGYSWSLDVYMNYAWLQLESLNSILIILIVLEAVLVQLTTLSYEFVLLMAANTEAMKRFSVFMALPSATIRGMASMQLKVDDDDHQEIDDDEMDAINAAQAKADADAKSAADAKDAAAAAKKKAVRVRLHHRDDEEEEDSDDDARTKKSKKKSRAAVEKEKANLAQQVADASKTHKTRWARINKFLFGWINTTYKINGKRLIPHNHILWRIMVPLLAWVATVIIIFAVSAQKLAGLQEPLASLSAAARVRSRVGRVHLLGSVYGFAEDKSVVSSYRARLLDELALMKYEYDALLYGGKIDTVAEDLTFDATSPAAAFTNLGFSNIFFTTTDCLRADQTQCYKEGDQYYHITHQGLDAIVYRFIDEMTVFANLPDELAYPNHTSYNYITYVAAYDMYDGLRTASTLFVASTISRFEEVKQMHIILLACTIVFGLLFVWKLFTPYVSKLIIEARHMAGVMSQLPVEVDIEGHIKAYILGIKRDPNNNMSMRAGQPGADPAAAAGVLPAAGALPGLNSGPMQMGNLLPPPGNFGRGLGGYGNGYGAVVPAGYGAADGGYGAGYVNGPGHTGRYHGGGGGGHSSGRGDSDDE